MNETIKEYLQKHKDLLIESKIFELFDQNNLVYPYGRYKDDIIKILQDAGIMQSDHFYLTKINEFNIAVCKSVNEFIQKEYSEQLKNPIGCIKELLFSHCLPKTYVRLNDPTMHEKPTDQNIVWWIEQGYLKGSVKFENGYIKTDSYSICENVSVEDILYNTSKCEAETVKHILERLVEGFEHIEKYLTESQIKSKKVEQFTIDTVAALEQKISSTGYQNIDISYKSEDICVYKISIKIKDIKKTLTTKINEYSLPGNTPEKLAQDLLEKIVKKLEADPNAPKPLTYSDIKQVLLKYGIEPRRQFTNKYAQTTTYKMQGGVSSLKGDYETLDKINDDLTALGFDVNSVEVKDSLISRGFFGSYSEPTLYINVQNK